MGAYKKLIVRGCLIGVLLPILGLHILINPIKFMIAAFILNFLVNHNSN